jgi:hypothetical protein
MITIRFYEGSYQFKSLTVHHFDIEIIERELLNQYKYRPTKADLWAIVRNDSGEISRWEFKIGIGLSEIKFN